MAMKAFEYVRPRSIREACTALAGCDGVARVLAGGTDVVVQMKEAGLRPETLISLKDVSGLDGVRLEEDGALLLGAATPLAVIEHDPEVAEHFPSIAEAASLIGSAQVRTRATVGGNLCNAAPSADMAPILLAHEAVAVVTDGVTERTLPLEEFFVGPGQTALGRGELLKAVRVPPSPDGSYARYYKSFRSAMDCCTVGVAVVAAFKPGTDEVEELRLALGAVAPTPVRARPCEQLLVGEELDDELIARAGEKAVTEAHPISDVRASAEYRRSLVRILSTQALSDARSWAERSASEA
jgi:carbon-monoxide dehydrogenase medium subunit